MFTVEPNLLETPVTKSELDSQLKVQLKGLHAQIKKDIRNEITQIVSKESTLIKMIEEALAKSMENAIVKIGVAKSVGGTNLQDGSATPIAPKKPVRTLAKPGASKMSNKAKLMLKSKSTKSFSTLSEVHEPRSPTSSSAQPWTASRSRADSGAADAMERAESVKKGTAPLIKEGTTDSDGQNHPLMTTRTQSREIHTNKLSMVERFVLNPYFEYGTAVMVIMNIIMIGIETQFQSSYSGHEGSFTHIATCLDISFCVIFTVELALRIYVYGNEIWLNRYLFNSTAFDAVMVTLQILDQVCHALSFNVHAASSLRIVRIVRIIRLVHLFDELSALISGMANSVESLLWAVFLLVLLMYMFSIGIMQVLMATGEMHSHDDLDRWFGTVDRAICTMFEVILGGLRWNDVLQALTDDVSPIMGFVLSFYIITALFFLMNLVCSVFVDRVKRTVREDKDETIAKRLSESLVADGLGEKEAEVTWEIFAERMQNDEAIQAYFISIELDPGNPKGLFELIDVDGSGTLTGPEILDGCLRLRGPAKAVDIAMMSSEIHLINRITSAHSADLDVVSKELRKVSKTLDKMQKLQIDMAADVTTIVAVPEMEADNGDDVR